MIPALLAALFTLTAPASAGGFDPSDAAEFSVLPGWRTESGTHMAAIVVDLAPGWKTYWRSPGEAGIPPSFDWDRSSNLEAVALHWPVPEVFSLNGLRTIGYVNRLILPIELSPSKPGAPIALRTRMELGLCNEICIPMQVTLKADLSADPAAKDRGIMAALASGPRTARDGGVRDVRCDVAPISDGLRLTTRIDMPRLGRDEVAVVELKDRSIWVSEAMTERGNSSLVAEADLVPVSAAPFMLDRSEVTITILSGGEAVEIRGCNAG
ncbi:MAG: hypothetical protein HUJ27_15190 [Rhodobacteraceae bacterium]|nr:hypothetical protein [Paracoccaceae bacterium]